MIGYVYIDIDGGMVYKTEDYIDNYNPGFWGQNSEMIIKYWKFDTEDDNNMRRIVRYVDDMKNSLSSLPTNFQNFILTINYDMNRLVKRANKI